MHTLTTRGRSCAVEEPVSMLCTYTDKDFDQVAAFAAAQITLSLLNQSEMHLRSTYFYIEKVISIYETLIRTIN